MKTLNIQYETLIEKIEGNETELVKKICGKLSFPKEVVLEKGISKSNLKWKHSTNRSGNVNVELIISKEQDDIVTIEYIKDIKSAQIFSTIFALAIGIYNEWEYIDFLYFLIAIWVLLPFIVSLQKSATEKKYVKRLEDFFND